MDYELISAGFWSVVPPIVAILLAFITKEVVFSLLMGIISGALIYSIFLDLGVLGIFTVTIGTMIEKLADTDNISIVIFMSILGGLTALIIRTGGSAAYGSWASQKIKSKKGAAIITSLLGLIIFIDDYFNCLTVGTVMRPITDRHKISREKLAYLIDSTAAPICIIAPISSWAGAIISYYPENTDISGMQAFLSSIPFNIYALLSIFMVFWISLKKKGDYGPMVIAECRAEKIEDVKNKKKSDVIIEDELERIPVSGNGKMYDLIVPILLLVIFSVAAMLWTGGFWDGEGKSLFEAFGNTNAGLSLCLAGIVTIFIVLFMFVPRKLIGFREFFTVIGTGIKSMVPALLILTLAWTISGICGDLLNTGSYVAHLVEKSSMPLQLIPVLLFIFASCLSFTTNSWGAFGLLIPIGITICNNVAPHLSIISLSAILAGSVFGDHCSPLADTTIMSSLGARCNHIDHVITQLPYGLTIGAVCIVSYLVSGFVIQMGYAISILILLSLSFTLLFICLMVLPKILNKRFGEIHTR